MRRTWRWFGPGDRTGIDDIMQCGVQGVVTALHHLAPGEVWTAEAIGTRRREVGTRADGSPSGLAWEVVESLPVSEDVKRGRGEAAAHVEAWKASLRNLAGAGIEVVCYNFMPVLDWTRTELAHRLPDGTTCMRYDHADFALFDIDLLERPGAAGDYPPEVLAQVEDRRRRTSRARLEGIGRAVLSGLPGQAGLPSPAEVRALLAEYRGVSEDDLRGALVAFLEAVAPVAQELGLRLCCHPDDPPFPLMGLPRIMSTEAQFRAVMEAVDLPANGVTLCSGSLGARGDADLPGFMRRLGDRVHFLHLRNVRREGEAVAGSFHETAHLDGDVDMAALVAEIVAEEARRRAAGRPDAEIPMRPDHGLDMLSDIGRGAQPGYPLVGRMRGLAELRGLELGLSVRGGA